jgi:chitin disaccharide deacetylase
VASTPSNTRLIINADDFGISRGVNTGIIEAARAGVVTSASVIVNLPDFADAIERAQSCPALSLGIHINLTAGKPVSDVPSMTRRESGEFHTMPVLMARASFGMLDPSEIIRECLAQIDRMIDAGVHPTHLDSHRHVHAHPAIFPAVAKAASARGIFQVRMPCEALQLNASDWRATLKKTGLLLCTHLSRRSWAKRGNHFAGISLQGGRLFASRLFSLIEELPSGTTELMTHPGYADASLSEYDSYTLDRVTELRVLCSREFQTALERSGVTLTTFLDRRRAPPPHQQVAQHYQP